MTSRSSEVGFPQEELYRPLPLPLTLNQIRLLEGQVLVNSGHAVKGTLLCAAGLEMIINIDQANYVKDAGETAGIRLVVHGGERMPFPEDEGITVSPGHSTSLGLQKVSTPTCDNHYHQRHDIFLF